MGGPLVGVIARCLSVRLSISLLVAYGRIKIRRKLEFVRNMQTPDVYNVHGPRSPRACRTELHSELKNTQNFYTNIQSFQILKSSSKSAY